ncbi:MAG: helix-turn-helix domain-containing protein [Desulfovibrionaceae bacterium]|nr:helix-turn-helix domain-containing protein [Desulfovibrionaceae bacterium]
MAIGGSEVAVRRLERGVQTPTVTTMILLAKALGITPEAFLSEIMRQMAFLNARG